MLARPVPDELRKRVSRKTVLREIARAYLVGTGMSVLGETAHRGGETTIASASSRVEALSNHQLVDEGIASGALPRCLSK